MDVTTGDPRNTLRSVSSLEISDVGLLRMVAEFVGLDAVALVSVGDGSPRVRASWPHDQAGVSCDDTTEAGRSRLLIASGGGGSDVVTATVETETGHMLRIHGNLISTNEISPAVIERELAVLVRLITLKFGAEIVRQHLDDVCDRMVRHLESGLAIGREISSIRQLLQIVESSNSLSNLNATKLSEFATNFLSREEKDTLEEVSNIRGRFGALIRNQSPEWLDVIARNGDLAEQVFQNPAKSSLLGQPIEFAEEKFSDLYIREQDNEPFADDDTRMFFATGSQATAAIDNLHHYEIEHQRANMLQSVQDIENAIRATSDPQETLNVMCATLGEKLGVDRVRTSTIEREHGLELGSEWHLSNLPPLGPTPDYMSSQAARLTEDMWRTVGRRVVDDYLVDPISRTEASQIFRRYTNARATIIAPIMVGNRAIGAIYVMMVDQPRKWTETEIRLVETVGGFVGQIIIDAEYRVHQNEHIKRLEQLERQQKNFVTTVTHELRTPLTSITGYLELLMDRSIGDLSHEQYQMLEVIDRNSNRLRKLIENILLLNLSEDDRPSTVIEDVDLQELVADAYQDLAPLAQGKAIALEMELDSDGVVVRGDKASLYIAILNVISNAIKFSQRGGKVSISCAHDRGSGRVWLTCQDHGIGIPAEDQSKLFSRFFRASNSVHEEIPGTGLGLHLVRQIIDSHGGQVKLTSAEGQGTTVQIEMPL